MVKFQESPQRGPKCKIENEKENYNKRLRRKQLGINLHDFLLAASRVELNTPVGLNSANVTTQVDRLKAFRL